MSTDDKCQVKTIHTDTLTDLFRVTRQYHRRRLREMFRKYYEPVNARAVWTKQLPKQVVDDLRLHLSWDLGIRTFTWNREQIGTRIIYRFKELGILLFMKKIITDDRNK